MNTCIIDYIENIISNLPTGNVKIGNNVLQYKILPRHIAESRIKHENTNIGQDSYEKDISKIKYSKSFRLLAYKLCVLLYGNNRMIHSIDVSDYTCRMCNIFELSKNLAESISLLHDIGQPPFSHAGEASLKILIGNFINSMQTFKVITEIDSPRKIEGIDGLNLTIATLIDTYSMYLRGQIKNLIPKKQRHNSEFNILNNPCKNIIWTSLNGIFGKSGDVHGYTVTDIGEAIENNFFTIDEISQFPVIKNIWNIKIYPKIKNLLCDIKENINSITYYIKKELYNTILNAHINFFLKQSELNYLIKENLGSIILLPCLITDLEKPINDEIILLKDLMYHKYYMSKNTKEGDEVAQEIVRVLFETFKNDPKELSNANRFAIQDINYNNPSNEQIKDVIWSMKERNAINTALRINNKLKKHSILFD